MVDVSLGSPFIHIFVDRGYSRTKTMARDVRIAVIDSGINSGHPHIASVSGGVAVKAGPCYDTLPEAYVDVLGHGTAVMAAIQEKAPRAQYFAVRLFHNTLSAKVSELLAAMEWSIEHEMDVINLSLGTPNLGHAEKLQSLVEEAARRGIVIVSARESNGRRHFPGALPRVVSVEVDWNCGRDSYWVQQTINGPLFCASGYPRPLPGVPLTRNLHGISFAVANMTGFVARACELCVQRSPEAICDALISESERLSSSNPFSR
jgi:hypothetical protein